jgi:DNA-binding Xre family transcriptional regulator
MKGGAHMQVHSRLREIMRERQIKVETLHRWAGVSREAISALRTDNWQRVGRSVMGRICGALNITLEQLFILNPEDIWAPIKLSGEVTVHYGSRSLPDASHAIPSADETLLTGQYIGVWDMRAIKLILEYLKQTGPEVSVTLQEHVTGVERVFDPSARDAVRKIFESGNHVVIGSPIANQFTEEVVCHAYEVPPYAPQKRDAFPYGFVWDSRRTITSSFGWQGIGNEFGIASTRSDKLVALRTMVKEGEGQDCALVIVYRIFVPPARRQHGENKECVVICILGHSGAGTFAGAQVATDPKYAGELYPAERSKPLMRVVRAAYTRAPIPSLRDNREVTGADLVTEPQSEPAPGDPPRGSGRPRPKKRTRQSPPPHRKSVPSDRSGRTESAAHPLLSAPRGR